MSRQINQPINQVRLTNVAVVRMNKGGKRFEIACYRNKVVDWRAGLELDLSEVLQTDRVFANVSKGEFAKSKDLQKVFGTKDEVEISKLILEKGQLQVSDKERNQQFEKTTAQIAEWISKNCVHPTSNTPYTISQIKHSMQQANFSVHPTKPLKRQYLDCVKLLQTVIPIQRAKMELLVVIPRACKDEVESMMKVHSVTFQEQQQQESSTRDGNDRMLRYPVLVDPSMYRVLNEALESIAATTGNSSDSAASLTGTARIEIINQVVTKRGDVNLESLVVAENEDHCNNNYTIDDRTNTSSTDLTDGITGRLKGMSVGKSHNDDEDTDDDYSNGEKNSVMRHYMDDDDDQEDDKGDVGSEEDDDIQMMDRRKAQKATKKKNKKTLRRTTNVDTTNTANCNDETRRRNNSCEETQLDNVPIKDSSSGPSTTSAPQNGAGGERKSCNTCGGSFETAAEYRSHFKSDWHRFNQKLKLKGCPPISEQEFLLCDADSLFTVDTGGF